MVAVTPPPTLFLLHRDKSKEQTRLIGASRVHWSLRASEGPQVPRCQGGGVSQTAISISVFWLAPLLRGSPKCPTLPRHARTTWDAAAANYHSKPNALSLSPCRAGRHRRVRLFLNAVAAENRARGVIHTTATVPRDSPAPMTFSRTTWSKLPPPLRKCTLFSFLLIFYAFCRRSFRNENSLPAEEYFLRGLLLGDPARAFVLF